MNNTKRVLEEQTLKLLTDNNIITEAVKLTLSELTNKIEKIYETTISPDHVEREKQYGEYRELIQKYGSSLGEVKYNLSLNKEEYMFLKALILNGLTYDRQNLFIGLLIRDEFFNTVDTESSYNRTSLFKNNNTEIFSLNITEITRISHLTGLHTIKGLDKKADLYADIIRKIGEISKIFEVYNSRGQDLSERGGNWLQGFEVYENQNNADEKTTISEQIDNGQI
jgi:hypothetical protein